MRLLAVLLFRASSSIPAFACMCMGAAGAKNMRDAAQWYATRPQVAAIFTGEVVKQDLRSGSVGMPEAAVSMTGTGQFRVVEFAVSETFRGIKGDRVSLVTGLGGGDCGYSFETRRKYIVYASSAPRMLFTSLCSGTKALEDGASDIRFLRNEKPSAEDLMSPDEYFKHYRKNVLPKRTGSICGTVLKPNGAPLKGAIVELSEIRDDDLPVRTASDPNTSDAAGHFCIQSVEPGRYLLTAEDTDFDHWQRYMTFYPGVAVRKDASPVVIEAGKRLPDVQLKTSIERLYSIDIAIVGPGGVPASSNAVCRASVNSPFRDGLSYHVDGPVQTDGTTGFSYIPAGDYEVLYSCYRCRPSRSRSCPCLADPREQQSRSKVIRKSFYKWMQASASSERH